MDPQSFVDLVQQHAEAAAVRAVTELGLNPPPRPIFMEWHAYSRWVRELDDEGRTMLQFAIEQTARKAVFGLFCILDGVRVVSEEQVEPSEGEFVLDFRSKVATVRLNDPNEPLLHDLMRDRL